MVEGQTTSAPPYEHAIAAYGSAKASILHKLFMAVVQQSTMPFSILPRNHLTTVKVG
jgi:hypothetical protein